MNPLTSTITPSAITTHTGTHRQEKQKKSEGAVTINPKSPKFSQIMTKLIERTFVCISVDLLGSPQMEKAINMKFRSFREFSTADHMRTTTDFFLTQDLYSRMISITDVFRGYFCKWLILRFELQRMHFASASKPAIILFAIKALCIKSTNFEHVQRKPNACSSYVYSLNQLVALIFLKETVKWLHRTKNCNTAILKKWQKQSEGLICS